MLAIKMAAIDMYMALPSALRVTQKGMTNLLTLLSILFLSSHARSISGIATALKYTYK